MATAQYFDWRFSSAGASLGGSLYERLPESTGTVYYVRTDGNNGNTGLSNTAGGAWASPNYAVDNAPANSIIKVGAGDYAEVCSLSRAFSSSTVLTLEAFDSANRPRIGSLTADSGGTASYVRARNLILDVQLLDPDGTIADSGNGTRYDCIKVGSGGSTEHHIEIVGCSLRNATGQGYNQQGHVEHVHVINCDVRNSGWYPGAPAGTSHTMYVRYGRYCQYLNLIIYGSVQGYSAQMHSDGTEAGVQDSIFANCVFDDSATRAGFRISQPDVAAAANAHARNQIKNCLMTNNGTWGVQIVSIGTNPSAGDEIELDRIITYNNTSGQVTNTSNAVVTNQQNANPLYVDQGAGDYRLQAGSPAIDAGDPDYTPTFDFTGTARTQADIGAYRYGA